MNAKVKAIIERRKDELNTPEFINVLRDAYEEGVWDEMIETLHTAGIYLADEKIAKIFEECERKRILIETNKAIEAGLNNK